MLYYLHTIYTWYTPKLISHEFSWVFTHCDPLDKSRSWYITDRCTPRPPPAQHIAWCFIAHTTNNRVQLFHWILASLTLNPWLSATKPVSSGFDRSNVQLSKLQSAAATQLILIVLYSSTPAQPVFTISTDTPGCAGCWRGETMLYAVRGKVAYRSDYTTPWTHIMKNISPYVRTTSSYCLLCIYQVYVTCTILCLRIINTGGLGGCCT